VPTDKHFRELAGVDHPLEEHFFNHVLGPMEGVPRLESILRKVYLRIVPTIVGCGLWVMGCGLWVVQYTICNIQHARSSV
jgi:hypothetical protein